MFSLEDKRVVITGGGRGLGAAMGAGIVQAGAEVCLIARSEDQLKKTSSEFGPLAHIHATDVAQVDAKCLFDEIEEKMGGPVDAIVHAAGIQHREAAEHFSPKQWENILELNLTTPFRLSQELGARQLERQMPGRHIFIGSLTSVISVQDISAYTAAKSGLMGVVRSLSTEWARHGILVNGILPGYFRTELTESVFDDESRYQKMLDRIPMTRFGKLEELAGAAVFLCSDASSYVTGTTIAVDGGWLAS